MKEFNRRYYDKFSAFRADFKAILSQRDQMRGLMRGESLDNAFRERLMLAVTSVNQCRYCSFAHARNALAEGIPEDEVQAILAGVVADASKEELPALLYAQHWAETRGSTDPAAREQFLAAYDSSTVEAIELAMCTIQMGNLMGNTLDYLLYRLSFGRLGGSPKGD